MTSSIFSRRNVLVTGAGGFVGRHLAMALHGQGAVVHGIGLGEAPELPDGVLASWRGVDLADREAVIEALLEVRSGVVFHLAGQASAARSFTEPVETFRANVGGTWNVLEAAREAVPHARILVVGTSEVYGPSAPGTRTSESAPFAPVSPYALSKAVAERCAEAWGRQHGMEVVRTRSFGHTGPGQHPQFALPSFARQLAAIERGEAEPVLHVGNLDVVRDLSDVRDVAQAYLALMERGKAGNAYNVCRGEGVKLADVVTRLVASARVPVRIEVDPARLRPADVPHLVGDPTAIERDTGWRATTPLETTLADVLEEWRGRVA